MARCCSSVAACPVQNASLCILKHAPKGRMAQQANKHKQSLMCHWQNSKTHAHLVGGGTAAKAATKAALAGGASAVAVAVSALPSRGPIKAARGAVAIEAARRAPASRPCGCELLTEACLEGALEKERGRGLSSPNVTTADTEYLAWEKGGPEFPPRGQGTS